MEKKIATKISQTLTSPSKMYNQHISKESDEFSYERMFVLIVSMNLLRLNLFWSIFNIAVSVLQSSRKHWASYVKFYVPLTLTLPIPFRIIASRRIIKLSKSIA